MSDEETGRILRVAIETLLRELIEGPAGAEAFMLNPGDAGLLASLDRVTAIEASARSDGRSSVAAHVDHVRYGLELLNRAARGEDPWQDAKWSASWERQTVSAEGWGELRASLRREANNWLHLAGRAKAWNHVTLSGTLGSIAHLAYHFGAIRQLARATSGPRAND
jgi:hypothetical protein